MDWREWDPSRLLAPALCLGCGAHHVPHLCGACLSQLEEVAGTGCRRCGNPAVHHDAATCSWCCRLKYLPHHLCTLYAYRHTGRSLFHRVKYEGYWRLIQPLLDHDLSSFFRVVPFLEYSCLAPIPESFSRKLRRHFNPAECLARSLSLRTGLPLMAVLKMKPFQKHQVGLTYEERRKNARNRFKTPAQPLPRAVILVDDVLTTGATLEAATRTLLEAGVQRVAWFTLFRTL